MKASEPVDIMLQVLTQENSVRSHIPVIQHSFGEETSVTAIGPSNSRLKPLEVPTFEGSKTRFEDFWARFCSLVDQTNEPVNIKMARLGQCLTGFALEAIRGLGVTQQEHDEAKAILHTKFGEKRRQLHAYMDQLEVMPPLKSNDVQGFEKFADLVRVSVIKLQADGCDGELGEGTLHGLLVRKLEERQVESYSRWLKENKKERSVVNFNEWMKEVRIRVEAKEMVY